MNDQDSGPTAGMRDRVEEAASETYDSVKDRASGLVDDVRHQAERIVDRQKSTIADQIGGVAAALHSAANELSSREQPRMADCVMDVAAAIDGISAAVRDRHVGDLAHDVEDLARRNPGVFLAGSVLVGFAAARFLRAVANPPPRSGTSSTRSWQQSESHGEGQYDPNKSDEASEGAASYAYNPGGQPGSVM